MFGGLGIQGLGVTRYQGVGGSLLDLFRNGEDGFLFGPFDTLERLFLLSTGNTGNVSANDDPVGLNLDRHGWNGASLTAILAAQTELLVAGSWIMGVAGGTSTAVESPAGTLTLQCDGTNAARGDQSFATVAGRTYRLSWTASGSISNVVAGTAQGSSGLLNVANQNSGSAYFVATSSTTWVRFQRSGTSSTIVVSAISCKLVPGNHAAQGNTGQRPLYKTNNGKPYLSLDGADDNLQFPATLTPGSAGTIAAAFNSSTGTATVFAFGTSTGDKRCRLTLDGSGRPGFVFNDQTAGAAVVPVAVDYRNTWLVLLQTWGGGQRRCYLNDQLVINEARASNHDGAGSIARLGSIEGGSPANFVTGGISAALCLNRIVTDAEARNIVSQFRRTFE